MLLTFIAPEELSEEDQQLKNELDMLVERLTVCSLDGFSVGLYMDSLTPSFLGIRRHTVQASARGNENLYQDLDIVHDCRTEASQVPQTPL
jgi:hypothetical protein